MSRCRVATVNAGSSTIKLALMEVTASGIQQLHRVVETAKSGGPAVSAALRQFPFEPDAVGHRIVHGGRNLHGTVPITHDLIESLESNRSLAPLHMGLALEGIHAAKRALPDLPAVAVFDSAFHADRTAASTLCALPRELVEPLDIYRYGFHGIAHASLVAAVAELEDMSATDICGVTLQLGGGCSACLVDRGRSVETSMGFTPLDGLVMMTRSGSIDPGIALHLLRNGYEVDELEAIFSQYSGLRGICGRGDMREILTAHAGGDRDASLAIDVFCRSIVATVGAYFTLAGAPGMLVFGGGIGANSPTIRARVGEGLAAWGVAVDPVLNEDNRGRISTADSVPVFAVQTDEERVIAREVAAVLNSERANSVPT